MSSDPDSCPNRFRLGWLGPCLALAVVLPLQAKTLLNRDEALSPVFPGASWERAAVYLSDEEKQSVAKLADANVRSSVIHTYRATRDGKLVGMAYLDQHRVRTLPETLLVVVTPDGVVKDVRVLEFHEPLEYMPGRAWYEQLIGRVLDRDLYLRRGIDGVTGATLTARATTQAARRALAIHRVTQSAGQP